MSRLGLRRDSKTGEPFRKNMHSKEKTNKNINNYVVIRAYDDVREVNNTGRGLAD